MHEWDKEINQKLQGLNLDPVREASIIEELRQHLNDCYAELIASGVSERDAYQQTLEELSDDELLARELKLVERQIHHNCFVIETNQRAKMITALWQDLRFGLRMLIKRPGFTLIAILTLALGMGVNTAIYSVLHAAFFASYPLTKPDEVLRVYGEDRNRNLAQLNMSVPKFQFVRDQQTVFSGLGAANYNGFTLLEQGTPVLINGAYVTANFLQTFGAVPIRGRFFEPQEEETASVAVLSESIWRARFNADP
ncbi:MAG TPA: ABC transporter permease, partial [Blastocatellia bacterium]|nr:ABC transporter permease [Blastocatellia bacterium]